MYWVYIGLKHPQISNLEVEDFEDAPETAENANDIGENFDPGNLLKNIEIPDNKSEVAQAPVNPEQQRIEVPQIAP